MERARKNIKKIKASDNPELIRRCFNPQTPDERMSFGEGAREAEREAEQTKRRNRQKLAGEHELPPLSPDAKGKLDIIHPADVLDGLAMIADGSVHLVVTSPPYAMPDVVYQNKESAYPGYAAWLDLMRRVFTEVFRVMANSGRVFIQIDACQNRDDNDPDRSTKDVAKMQTIIAEITNMMRDIGFHFGWEHCWYKQNSVGHRPNWGTKFSPRCPTARRQHEYILGFHKGPAAMDGPEEMIDITDEEFIRFTMSHWYIPPENRMPHDDPAFHPAPFPVLLVYALLRLYSYRGMTVLDPFAGSGTTCFVARATGRRYIGIDNSPSYVEAAQARISTLDGLTPENMWKALEITPEALKRLNSHLAMND